MAATDQEAKRLRELLTGQLDRAGRHALETRLAERPSLRRRLADMALEADVTRPAIRVQTDVVADEQTTVDPALDVGPMLGRGGMAVVRLGRQLKLDRPVAIKALSEGQSSDVDVARLLTEARITGRLEHPNIVPVHDIVRGEDGLPQVVLKLIEGHTWSDLMTDAARVQELFAADDLLDWNLEVIMAVARALSFAHSRNVLHRDVKPSNVMVGPFGEVYLMDWGIALDLDDEDADREQPSGTSAYMAPEQLGHYQSRLGPWTDTYLLGATLYRVLAGVPPHEGDLEDRFVVVPSEQRPPPLPDTVPAELRKIVDRALEPDPDRRTPSPERFRLEIVAFLQHRGALRLARRGDRERARAEGARAGDDEAAWERASLAAELAYRAALEEWSDCAEARAGLRALGKLRIERALDRDDAAAAARFVDAQEDVEPALAARVAEAQARADEEEERLRQIVTDADRGLGHRMRGLLGGGFGVLWLGFWGWMAFDPPATVVPMIAFTLAVGVVGTAGVVKFAPEMLQNRINLTSVKVTVSGLALMLVWLVGGNALALPIRTLIIGSLFVCATFAAGMATLMDPWGTISALGFSGAFVVACYEPTWTPWAMVGGNVVLVVNQLVLNYMRARRGFEQLPEVGPRRRRRPHTDTQR